MRDRRPNRRAGGTFGGESGERGRRPRNVLGGGGGSGERRVV